MDRQQRIEEAVRAIDARGDRPTARAVLSELSGRRFLPNEFPNGMGGRDLRFFEKAMTDAGYHRVQVGQFSWNLRWRKIDG